MIKKLFVFLTAIVMALTVAVAPQAALAHHEDENCADWGTCPAGYYWDCYIEWNMWPPQQVCGWYPYY